MQLTKSVLAATLILLCASCQSATMGPGGLAVDFQTLKLKDSPNQFLLCPADYCPNASPHRVSSAYDASAATLRDTWHAMTARQPRTKLAASDHDNLQYDYVQRSLIFRFPDTITVRFLPLDDQQSTLAVYSRSTYGHSDLGGEQKAHRRLASRDQNPTVLS